MYQLDPESCRYRMYIPPSPSLVCLMSQTTTEGGKSDCGGGGGESRDLGPMATPVDGDTATVDGDGGREVKGILYGTIWLHTI